MFKKINKRKNGQALIEFLCVLSLYFLLIGFMITGFQVMHNKIVFSLAAYEGARTAVAYNPASGGYDISGAQQQAKSVTKNAIGLNSVNVQVSPQGKYVNCTVSADVKYLFPIINSNGIGSRNQTHIKTGFVMRKENPQLIKGK